MEKKKTWEKKKQCGYLEWKVKMEGEMREERPEERAQVSNHLPMSLAEKVHQKLFIKETRPTLLKRIVCFPPHPIHSEWNVQSKWCAVVKTFQPPPLAHQPLCINILTLTIDFETSRDKMWIHISSSLHKKWSSQKCATNYSLNHSNANHHYAHQQSM